jgi:hypothetical protein
LNVEELPTMKKGNVEMLQAQRAIACLEAAMDKLHVLSLMRADGTSVMLPSQLPIFL